MKKQKTLLAGLCLAINLVCQAQACPPAVSLPSRPDDVSKYLPIKHPALVQDSTCPGGWHGV